MKRRKSILLLMGTLMCLAGYTQSYVGYGYDNYAGVQGLLLNPGMLADSKYKVNVNIISASVLAGNNAYEIDRSKLLGLHFSGLHEGDGYYKIANNSQFKYAYLNSDIVGPSAMVSINSKTSIGLITRMRVMGNEYNLSNSLFQLLGNANPSFYNTDITDRSLQTKLHAFAEAGFSLGRVLMKNEHGELKAGVTAKYISGLGFAGVSSGQLLVNIDPLNNINTLNADISTPYSSNLDNLGNGSFSNVFNKQAGHGWGMDLGVVYEWTPKGTGAAPAASSDEPAGWLSKDLTPYKLRLGLSLTDLGSVNYTNSADGQTYTMNASGHNSSELQKQSGETYNQYITRLKTDNLIVPMAGPAKLNVALPTAVHVNIDYHVYKRIFVNGDVLVNMVSTTNLLSPNYTTSFTFTPRLEKKWVSIYSPLSYNVEGQMNWGAGLRFGPVFLGSGSIISNILKNRIQAADVHVGISIPIFKTAKSKDDKKTDTLYKNIMLTHDRDGDGVVDEKDACPDSAGPIALIGCPDRDGDGVPNYKDKCPDVPGSPNFNGCPAPDSDGDSVNDDEDKCPHVKGSVSNYGCPLIQPELIERMNNAADRIFFVRAKAVIEKNCYQELDRVVAILQSDSTLHLHIEGHTDTEGTDERNQRLSQRRAKAVKKFLEGRGIPASRMDTEAYGSKHPIAPNATAEGMAQNRRVEMKLTNYSTTR